MAAVLMLVTWMAACVPVALPSPAKDTSSLPMIAPQRYADVRSVTASGVAGAYQFSVEVASPDTGCDQYADWWEVLADDGTLLYRRILTHSHVTEQPFTRSGGPIDVVADTVVWVRAHIYPTGFGGRVMRGSVAEGFVETTPPPGMSGATDSDLPRPDCTF